MQATENKTVHVIFASVELMQEKGGKSHGIRVLGYAPVQENNR
jgi:hypothetical protein